jgi:putative transposase
MVAAIIRTAFVQDDQIAAREQWRETADKVRKRFPKLSELMDRAKTMCWHLCNIRRRSGHSWHRPIPLERLNKEIKRRSRVVEISLTMLRLCAWLCPAGGAN